MSLCIKRASLPSKEALRALLIESLATFMGKCSVVDKALPCTGTPILLLDSRQRLTLLCFDVGDPGKVLLNGISAWEECNNTRPWMNRQYPSHTSTIPEESIALAMVVNSKPAGIELLLRNNHNLSLYLFQVLRVNNEIGLLVEPLEVQDQAERNEHVQIAGADAENEPLDDSVLTEEETEFFKIS